MIKESHQGGKKRVTSDAAAFVFILVEGEQGSKTASSRLPFPGKIERFRFEVSTKPKDDWRGLQAAKVKPYGTSCKTRPKEKAESRDPDEQGELGKVVKSTRS